MRVVVATTNRGKLEELRALLPEQFQLVTLGDVDLEAPKETGTTFLENARIKARAVANAGYVAIADDSGLEVDALGGAPGVWSARYAGIDASDEDNNRKLIANLANVPDRMARFRSAVVLIDPAGDEVTGCGYVEGVIVDAPRGSNGFGYDPHFEIHDRQNPEFNGRTMAEIELSQKNRISHRSRAYRALLHKLSQSDLIRGNLHNFIANAKEGNSA